MGELRSQTVNLCSDDRSSWQAEGPGAAQAQLRVPGMGVGSPCALTLGGPGVWRSVPRHAEPQQRYGLECDVKGRCRIGLVWVREGRPLPGIEAAATEGRQVWTSPDEAVGLAMLTGLGAVWSEEVEARDWRRLTVEGVSPVAGNRVQAVLASLGEGEAVFDAPYLDGLGAVPLEVVIPAGCHAQGMKVAIVAVRERAEGGRFEVVRAGEVVQAGELRRWGEYLWGREYWQADFTELRAPGRYRLRVAMTDGRAAESPEFEVGSDLYLRLARLTVGWYTTQRCGVEVPGWHPPCHLDDALIGRSRNRPLGPGGEWEITGEADLTGGWHDAGDNHKYICWAYTALWALARLARIGPGLLQQESEGASDPLEEACWEARFILKTMSPEGLFPLGVISRFGWISGPCHQETDNIRGTGDERALPAPEERICDIPTYGPVFTSALIASSLADVALSLRGREDGFAQELLVAARRTWDHHHGAEPPDAEYLRWHAAFALLDAALLRHAGEPAWQEDLEARVGRIIAQQRPEGVFPFPRECQDYREQVLGVPREQRARLPYLSPAGAKYAISHEACGLDYIPAPFTYLHALLDYLELFPGGPQAEPARRALDRALALAWSLSERTPFGQMMEWTFAPDPVNFVHMFHGYNCALLSLATVAARAARALARPELLALAERQMQWVLGRNPRATSLVSGVGHKQLGLYHTGLCHQPGHRTGEQPGGVVNGFVSMAGERIGYSGPTYPWDFPYLDLLSPAEEAGWLGSDAAWWTNETWVPNCAWFMRAAVALHQALGAANAQGPPEGGPGRIRASQQQVAR